MADGEQIIERFPMAVHVSSDGRTLITGGDLAEADKVEACGISITLPYRMRCTITELWDSVTNGCTATVTTGNDYSITVTTPIPQD